MENTQLQTAGNTQLPFKQEMDFLKENEGKRGWIKDALKIKLGLVMLLGGNITCCITWKLMAEIMLSTTRMDTKA